MYRVSAVVLVICAVVVLVVVLAWSTRVPQAPSVCVLTRHPLPRPLPSGVLGDAAWLSCEPSP